MEEDADPVALLVAEEAGEAATFKAARRKGTVKNVDENMGKNVVA